MKVYLGISFEAERWKLCPNLHSPQQVQMLSLKMFVLVLQHNWRTDCSSEALSCSLKLNSKPALLYGIIRESSDAMNKDALNWQLLIGKSLDKGFKQQLKTSIQNSLSLVQDIVYFVLDFQKNPSAKKIQKHFNLHRHYKPYSITHLLVYKYVIQINSWPAVLRLTRPNFKLIIIIISVTDIIKMVKILLIRSILQHSNKRNWESFV